MGVFSLLLQHDRLEEGCRKEPVEFDKLKVPLLWCKRAGRTSPCRKQLVALYSVESLPWEVEHPASARNLEPLWGLRQGR